MNPDMNPDPVLSVIFFILCVAICVVRILTGFTKLKVFDPLRTSRVVAHAYAILGVVSMAFVAIVGYLSWPYASTAQRSVFVFYDVIVVFGTILEVRDCFKHWLVSFHFDREGYWITDSKGFRNVSIVTLTRIVAPYGAVAYRFVAAGFMVEWGRTNQNFK